jgi:general stress protein 26
MTPQARAFVLDVLAKHNILTLATVRPDGWPQATTVAYASDGLDIYVGVAASSQKVANIRACDKVSLTIDHDEADWSRLKGLSMAARAEVLSDRRDIDRALALLQRKFPQYGEMPESEMADFAVLRIRPWLISLLDYSKGFGYTELVEV